MPGNPNPSQKLKPKGEKALSKTPITAKLPLELDAYVRSHPLGMAEYVRQALAEKMEREQAQDA